MRRALPEVRESLEELQSLLGRITDLQTKRRVHLLLLIRSEKVRTRDAAAEHLVVHRNSVGTWLAKYEKGGLDALLEVGTPGAKPGIRVLTPGALEALKARLAGEGFDSYKQIQQWIKDEFATEIPYPTVHALVRYRLQSKLKRARPRHVKKTAPMPPSSPAG